MNVYESAYVALVGSSKNLWIDACGSNVIELSDFRVEDATLDASCASTVVVYVDGRLDADASQNAHVYYLGNPDLSGVLTAENASVEPKQ